MKNFNFILYINQYPGLLPREIRGLNQDFWWVDQDCRTDMCAHCANIDCGHCCLCMKKRYAYYTHVTAARRRRLANAGFLVYDIHRRYRAIKGEKSPFPRKLDDAKDCDSQ